MNRVLKLFIHQRFIVQILIGAAFYFAVSWLNVSLWIVLGVGVVTGLAFGKVFCRWMCPLGVVMGLIMGLNTDQKFRQLYQYHKVGCPIAWVQGFLNKFSLLKIRIDNNSCKNCGLCDKECYIAVLEPEKFSLYKKDKIKPGESFTCSKCLNCVASCPNGSLTYK